MPKQPEAREPDQPLALSSSAVLGHTPRHPTLAECEAAGRGPENYPGKPLEVGGLPATKEERARFEAYMRGHCWDVGHYVDADECYDTTFVRCLWGVWRDRGALPTVWPNVFSAASPDVASSTNPMPDFIPARLKDGTLYEGNQRYARNGLLRSCSKCHTYRPTAGFRKTRYGMTCARCVQQMEKK